LLLGVGHKKLVMPGLVPGIHVSTTLARRKDVDGRDEPGHDEEQKAFA
jgi:hypothetical protein